MAATDAAGPRTRARGALTAAGALAAGTVALAVVPTGVAGGALAGASTLASRVAPDWLAVAALVFVAGRSLGSRGSVSRRTGATIATAVLATGFAVAVSPLAATLADAGPEGVGAASALRVVSVAARDALFPTGLFLATVAGLTGPHASRSSFSAGTVAHTLRPLGAVAACSAGLAVATRLALGTEYVPFVLADAGVAALTGFATYGVLAVALVAVATGSVGRRRLPAAAAGVALGLFAVALVASAVGGLLGVALVTAGATPMAVVERSTLAYWPSPLSPSFALATVTFLAGAVGLLAVRRTTDTATTGSAAGSGSAAGDQGDPEGTA